MKLLEFSEKKLRSPRHIAPLAVFRVLFGLMMFLGALRFMAKGWVSELYIEPEFYFSYSGFEWIKPIDGYGMYLVFAVMAVAALMVALGLFYKVAITSFFVLFTYIELLDKSNYLNHYYFVSIISFLMIWLPAHRFFSIDVLRNPAILKTKIPFFNIFVIQLQLGLVYFFAGLAKINSDWLLEAMPLGIWLPANSHLPLIGYFLTLPFTAYFFSWFGCLYDLSIPFLLSSGRTRPYAYCSVIAFHLLTAMLFQIGMFPWVMIVSTLIFFREDFHLLLLKPFYRPVQPAKEVVQTAGIPRLLTTLIIIHFIVQLAVPLRFIFYPGKLFWTEQGYRFSWRVMLMEKAGQAFFYVKDKSTGGSIEVVNSEFLTPNQEKMMATQPDMILQYAHFLKEEYQRRGLQHPAVTAEVYVTLNGQRSQPFIDSRIDLSSLEDGFSHKDWVLPFNDSTPLLASGNGK